jgi:hypothetical protein
VKKEKDPNYVVKVEKAIKEKYGEETIVNPKSKWDKKKESKYLEGLRNFYDRKKEKSPKIKIEDFYVSEKLVSKDISRSCPICEEYSFDVKDDLYMNKFDCCFSCYVQYIEGRKERWKEGWRPKKQ